MPSEGHQGTNDHVQDTSQPKSPLLTSHRLSTISLDNVNLGEDVAIDAVIPKGMVPLNECSVPRHIISQKLMGGCR